MPSWGEEDVLLCLAYDQYKQNMCQCGSGFWTEDCCDVANKDRFQVEEVTHYAPAALDRWHKDNPEPDPGVQPSLRLLPRGVSAEESVRNDMADLQRRIREGLI